MIISEVTINEPEKDSPSQNDQVEMEHLMADTDPLTLSVSSKTTPSEEHVLEITEKQCSDNESERNKKSCLSLPMESLNGPTPSGNQDRRKLSVQGLMGFAERRRSSGAFLAELTRKMSITNSEGYGSRSPGNERDTLHMI